MAELHKNTFEAGLDTNLAKSILPPNKFIEGLNIDLTGIDNTNKVFAVENIAGSTNIDNLIIAATTAGDFVVGVSYEILTLGSTNFTNIGASGSPIVGEVFTATGVGTGTGTARMVVNNREILGVFKTSYVLDSGGKKDALTVFSTYTNLTLNYLQIQAYITDVTESGQLYDIYRQEVPDDYLTSNVIIDAVSYAENSFDYLYFTDNYYPVRKIKGSIVGVDATTPNFLTKAAIEFSRPKALGDILLNNVSAGGSLLTGSYQLAYQLVSADKTKFTNFSLLTIPIHVYTTINGLIKAGIGLPSNKKISIHITPTEFELANYTYFRVAIVENINPSGTVNTDIGITKLETIADYLSGGYIQDYEITSNAQLASIPIDELVVDLIALDKVKSIRIRDNRLLMANVSVKSLAYDNGTPVISGSSTILKETGSGDSFSSDLFSSANKGYFRDEVYRFAISYFDEYGNFSYPSVLDCSVIQDNQISSGTDMKFPARSFTSGGRYYTLFDASNNTQSLGLELMDVNNHPTWAKGFIILRAKRKKNILFQTPIVPFISLYGIGAVGEYPTIYQTPSTTVTDTTLSPMGPSTVFMPMNMFYGGALSTFKSSASGGSHPNLSTPGESFGLSYDSSYDKGVIFPPESMYNSTVFTFSGNEQVKTIDAALTNLYFTRFDAEAYNCGRGENSSCSGSFFAAYNNDYYYQNGHGGGKPSIRSSENSITASKFFDNYSAAFTLSGFDIWNTDKLTTQVTNLGTTPITQRGTAIDLGTNNTVLSGPYASPALTFSSGSPTYKAATSGILNDGAYITSTSGLYGYTNVIELVNILKGYDDLRYGDALAYNEYIYTGYKKIFTDAEVATYISQGTSYPVDFVQVWGGDCIVSPHCFKISDNNYTVVNTEKTNGAGSTATALKPAWSKIWLNVAANSSVIQMPAPVKKSAQYLTVVLESEYHGSVRDIDTYNTIGTYNFPIYGATTEGTASSPLTYGYNINLNKENDQKIFVPQNELDVITNTYPARIYYTDQKIYNSTIQGFDITRVLNYKDLSEKFGDITSLAIAGDNLYAIQEKGISFIPVGQRIIETTDASQLSIQSGEILGEPLIIDSVRGSIHLRGILETGDELFIVDQPNKDIYKLSDQTLKSITKEAFSTNSTINFNFGNTVDDKAIICLYDYYRDHFWVYNKSLGKAFIYGNKYGFWQAAYEFPNYLRAAAFNKGVYLIGDDQRDGFSGELSLDTMYTGERTSLFGEFVIPSITFVVNPNTDFGKTFDNVSINSSNPLLTLDVTVDRNSILGAQSSINTPVDVTTRGEGNYRIKTLRDANGARLRGLYADYKFKWNSEEDTPKTLLNSVITSYRLSK